MNKIDFEKFVNFLQKDHKIYGPVLDRQSKRLLIEEVNDPKKILLNGKVAHYSFKKLFFPACESLFDYKDGRLQISDFNYGKQVVLGMTVFDLKALCLYDQVFAEDPYYQARRAKTLVIGYNIVGKKTFREEMIFQEKYEENILEHLKFDIFLQGTDLIQIKDRLKTDNTDYYKVIVGSSRGQEVLERFGYKDYENIEYVGPIKEEGLDEKMVRVWKKLKKGYNKKIWEKLGKKCIECGQCTIVCPTCYCFRIDDEPSLNKGEGKRARCWDSCLYHEFSEVAGDCRFLDTTEKRMWFWFYHKFVRVPEKYKIPGCVKCGRCSEVCPVGIDFMAIVESILEN